MSSDDGSSLAGELRSGHADNDVCGGLRVSCLRGIAGGLRLLPKGRSTVFRAAWRGLGSPPAFRGAFRGVDFVVRPGDAATSLTPFLHQQYEPLMVELICDCVPVGGVFIDVGANVGLISLQVLQHIGNEGRVISYEPLPQNVADMTFIRKSAEARASRWLIETFALSDVTGKALVEWNGEAGWCRISEGGDIEIERRTFDDERVRHQLQFVDCVKIDVEGHEASVVRGMRASIAAGAIGAVLVELHLKVIDAREVREILSTFLGHKYRAFVIHGRGGAGGRSGIELEEVGVDYFPRSRSHLLFRKETDLNQKFR